MNVYDFDETIYDGDCTVDFYIHCFKRFPKVRRHSLSLIRPVFRFVCFKGDKTEFKQAFFGFLKFVPEQELEVLLFWDRHEGGIKRFYGRQQRPDDIIITASPEFLVSPIMKRLGVAGVIGSRVDIRNGAFGGANCHGAEKVRRFRLAHPDAVVDEFYSDSRSDSPMAELAARAYIVKGDKIVRWG